MVTPEATLLCSDQPAGLSKVSQPPPYAYDTSNFPTSGGFEAEDLGLNP